MTKYTKQDDQLSQRDRAAEWVGFGQKLKTIFCKQYRSIFNYCEWRKRPEELSNSVK